LGLGGDRRLPAVRRIDDERGLPEGARGRVAAEGSDGVVGVADAGLYLFDPRSELLVGLTPPSA
jgi:hypothetical protein